MSRGSRSVDARADVHPIQSMRVALSSTGAIRFHCVCGEFHRTSRCPHLWALILEADARHLEVVDAIFDCPERIGVRVEAEGAAASATEAEEASEAEAGSGSSAASPVQRALTRREREHVRAWAEILECVGQLADIQAERIAPAAAAEPPLLSYVMDFGGGDDDEEDEDALGLALEIRVRRPHKRGGHGEEREVDRLSESQLAALLPEDRRIVAMLCGAATAAGPWPRAGNWTRDLAGRYELDQVRADLLLPLLCATGRLSWSDEGKRSGSLRWDGDLPFEFELALEGDDGRTRVLPRLRRGDEILTPDDAVAFSVLGYAFMDERVIRWGPTRAYTWILALPGDGGLTLPESKRDDVLRAIVESPAVPRIATGALEIESAPAPTPILRAEAVPSQGKGAPIRCAVTFRYGATEVPGSLGGGIAARTGGGFWKRDEASERAAWTSFLDAAGLVDAAGGSQAFVPAERFPEVVSRLYASGWEIFAANETIRAWTGSRVSVRTGIDWFDIEGVEDFGGQGAPLPELLEAARKRTRFVPLGDGSLGMLPETWLSRWEIIAGLAQESGGDRAALRFARSQAWLLDALLAVQATVEADEAFQQIRSRLRAFQGIARRRESAGFRGRLRPYQRDGLSWLGFLRDTGFGGCLADDMGLGKTVQVLAHFESLSAAADGGGVKLPSLIVAPRSLVPNWIHEAARFAPALRVVDASGADRAALWPALRAGDIAVTTYGCVRRDIEGLHGFRFDTVVLDEAQMIKNAGAQVAKAARLLRADHRLALSGTPIENHLGELWSLFEFLNPGMLGRASAFEKLSGKPDSGLALDAEGRAVLGSAIRPFVLRRTKQQVLSDLPEKVEQTVWCTMGADQRREYDAVRDHYRASLLERIESEGIEKLKIQVLEALLRLRQVACHPALVDAARGAEPATKIETLVPMLRELRDEGHKALVFSQFTSFLAIVRRALDVEKIPYEYLDGRTRDRDARVRRFQEDAGCPVFLLSLKAGGLGLNLTAAEYVFLLDPWWNPAVESQAIDRAHRIGQTAKVMAYRLVCRDTIEEKILALQDSKRELASAILASDGKTLRSITREDLERLLS